MLPGHTNRAHTQPTCSIKKTWLESFHLSFITFTPFLKRVSRPLLLSRRSISERRQFYNCRQSISNMVLAFYQNHPGTVPTMDSILCLIFGSLFLKKILPMVSPLVINLIPVSYTHLDVYKRQFLCCLVCLDTFFLLFFSPESRIEDISCVNKVFTGKSWPMKNSGDGLLDCNSGSTNCSRLVRKFCNCEDE